MSENTAATLSSRAAAAASTTTSSSSFLLLLESFLLPYLIRGSGLVLGIISLVGGLLWFKQDSLLYMPVVAGIPRRNLENPRGYQSPAERNVPFRSLRIPCRDGVVIHAWLLLYTGPSSTSSASTSQQQPFSQSLQQPEPQRLPTILFFHGNAGNIGLRLPNAIPMMQQLHCHVLLVEYRGYGDSDNVPQINEAGIQMDAMAVLDYVRGGSSSITKNIMDHDSDDDVRRYIDANQLYIFGRSLGGAVAFFLAHYALEHDIPGIVGIMVENTFTSISDMVDVIFPPFLAPIKHLILRIGWNSAAIIPQLQGRIPTLFLAGAKDQIVPHHHMLTLHQLALQAAQAAASKNQREEEITRMVQMHVIANGTHNESWYQGGRAYWKAMVNFVQQTRGPVSSTSATATTTTTTTATASRSDSTASSASSASQQPTASSSIPTMSARLLDIATETITGHGVAVSAPGVHVATATASSCQAAENNDKKNI